MSPLIRICKPLVDVAITLFLWSYFLFGYSLFFIPLLILLTPFSGRNEALFQKINHHFYRFFFLALGTLTPGLTLKIGKDVKTIRSAVVVANHRSYLDPIMLISLFPRQRTIVKGVFFRVPIMRWVMTSSGYIPFDKSGEFNDIMAAGIQGMDDFFREGGVLFIFPEGRRHREKGLGRMQKGAFSIAARFNVPVEVLYIESSDRLFTPGKFLFNTCIETVISVERLGTITQGHDKHVRPDAMRDEAVWFYRERILRGEGSPDIHSGQKKNI